MGDLEIWLEENSMVRKVVDGLFVIATINFYFLSKIKADIKKNSYFQGTESLMIARIKGGIGVIRTYFESLIDH
jgi:hypothetical protein